ncbi:MAG: hypothetical protein HYS98_01865 [Deltaproteobacteria bacterium]|nr:hypothetical protein [Deltaproteobacteria bacterium]
MQKRRRKKRCFFCHGYYWAQPELKEKQYTCGKKSCQMERRNLNGKRWRKKNPLFQTSHCVASEIYKKEHRKWKQKYRREHPQYVEKNKIYVKRSKLKGKSIESQKLDS